MKHLFKVLKKGYTVQITGDPEFCKVGFSRPDRAEAIIPATLYDNGLDKAAKIFLKAKKK